MHGNIPRLTQVRSRSESNTAVQTAVSPDLKQHKVILRGNCIPTWSMRLKLRLLRYARTLIRIIIAMGITAAVAGLIQGVCSKVSRLYLPTQRVLKFYCWPGEGEKVLPSNCTVEESKNKNKKRTFTAITKAILSTNNMPLFNHHWYWTLAADKQINWNIPVALVHVNALLGIRTCVFLKSTSSYRYKTENKAGDCNSNNN